VPQAIEIKSYKVSRESGLDCTKTTFGVGNRFRGNEKVVGRGAHSPNGREFYGRNPLYKLKMEVGRESTQGIGERAELYNKAVPRKVGPGSYNIVASAAKERSPLDGPEYCYTTLHKKLPSKLVPADMCSPGPHHSYEVRKPLDNHLPAYGRQNLSYGSRHPPVEDTDGPGLGYNSSYDRSVAKAASVPNLNGAPSASQAGGTKRCVKSTFGMADRFKASRQTSSPVGEMYYAHSKLLDQEDYMSAAKTCGFGFGGKTDFANPYHGHRLAVSPVTYRPVTSTAKKTSSFDGLVTRNESPTVAHCRALGISTRSRSSPMGFRGAESLSSSPAGPKASAKTPTKGATSSGDADA
jgi:hypothetical protein